MNPGFCRCCGRALETRVPAGDDRPRDCCPACGHIEYRNPRVRAGCIALTVDGTPVMHTVLLSPGERLQDAVLRAVGAAVAEEHMRLYCAVSDPAGAEISLVFRGSVPLFLPMDLSAERAPGWAPALIARFVADLAHSPVPVYTAEAGGPLLQLCAVGAY